MKRSEDHALNCSQEIKRMSLLFLHINKLLILLTIALILYQLTKLHRWVCQSHYLHEEHI